MEEATQEISYIESQLLYYHENEARKSEELVLKLLDFIVIG